MAEAAVAERASVAGPGRASVAGRAAVAAAGRASVAAPAPVSGRASVPGRASGPVLFARYAFAPNRFGYCGPDAAGELIGEATSGGDDRAIRQLARGFDGAWPYLGLIAGANGIADPLDRRVVEAYWLGSELLDRVSPDALGGSLTDRFRPRLRADGWRWLAGKPAAGAAPVHAFHVLDVFPRVGLLRSGSVDRALEVMESCRIRWGRVLERDGSSLVASVVPLELVDGRLALGSARAERVEGWWDGAGFVDDVGPGDVISIHWGFACDRLDPDQLDRLVSWTRHQVRVANETI